MYAFGRYIRANDNSYNSNNNICNNNIYKMLREKAANVSKKVKDEVKTGNEERGAKVHKSVGGKRK